MRCKKTRAKLIRIYSLPRTLLRSPARDNARLPLLARLHFSARKYVSREGIRIRFQADADATAPAHASFELHENRVGFLRTDTRESRSPLLDRSTLQIQGEIIALRPRIAGTRAIKSARGEEGERGRVKEKRRRGRDRALCPF